MSTDPSSPPPPSAENFPPPPSPPMYLHRPCSQHPPYSPASGHSAESRKSYSPSPFQSPINAPPRYHSPSPPTRYLHTASTLVELPSPIPESSVLVPGSPENLPAPPNIPFVLLQAQVGKPRCSTHSRVSLAHLA